MKKTSPVKFLLIAVVAIVSLVVVQSCQKPLINEGNLPGLPISQQELSDIENSINSFYDLKKDLALQFNSRANILSEDIFYSDEIESAVRYELLMRAQMGMIKEFSHDVKILSNEFSVGINGNVIGSATANVTSLTINDSGERIESAYTEKLFFSFAKKDGQWKLLKIDQLSPQYELEKKYSEDVVFPFTLTKTELQEKAKADKDTQILLEQREAFELYFDEKIGSDYLATLLQQIAEKHNLIGNEQKTVGPNSPQLQAFNKTNMVNYALTWTSAGSGSSTAPYNPAYKFWQGTDCANYASQCLKAGGWQYANPYNSQNSTWVWWYKTNNTSSTSDDIASSTWINANNLCNYIVVNNNYATFTPNATAHASANAIKPADLCWEPAWGVKTHVMIVTKTLWTNNYLSIYMSGHTANMKNWLQPSNYAGVTFGHFP